jgi:hypothetical protein
VLENDLRACLPKDMLSLKLNYNNDVNHNDSGSNQCLPFCVKTDYVEQAGILPSQIFL